MLYRKLLSEYYDLAFPDIDEKELNFWLKNTCDVKGNVLEIGCGNGRILIPLLRRNVKIMGIDKSGDMLDVCKEKCNKLNLEVKLFKQSMQELNLPYKFEFIFIPDGTIGFAIKDEEIKQVFMNIYSHLLTGGDLIFDLIPPWGKNLEEKHGVWKGDWKKAEDKSIYSKRILTQYNSNTNLREGLLIIEKYQDGKLVNSEEDFGITRYFSIDEIITYLNESGFNDIKACSWLTNEPVSGNPSLVTIKCTKPA
jgi:SAM-dependent methyltransferase